MYKWRITNIDNTNAAIRIIMYMLSVLILFKILLRSYSFFSNFSSFFMKKSPFVIIFGLKYVVFGLNYVNFTHFKLILLNIEPLFDFFALPLQCKYKKSFVT